MASSEDKSLDKASKNAFRRKGTSKEPPGVKSVDDIWSEAIRKIEKDYDLSPEDLEKWDRKLGDGETGTERAQALFANSRHPGDKQDKVMKTVGNCLEWVQDGLGFVKNNISGTYAVPVQILTGSISYMVQAAQDVTEDFNLIESTFETLDNALHEIGDLRQFNFKSDSTTFLERLTAIFVAMVKLCVLSGKVFSTSRKKRWVKALFRGKDQNIAGACADVEKAIKTFRDIVPLQTLGQIQAMGTAVSTAVNGIPDRIFEQLQTKLKYSDLQPLWGRSPKSLDLIKDLFKRTNLFHAEIESRMETQMELVDKELVPGTFSWTEDDSTYQAWESGRKDPYLFILGNTGSGKTFFACHCYKSIQQRSVKTMATSEDSSERKRAPLVTYFPFKIGREESQNLGSVLAYTIFQIARQNTKLCDSIARDLQVSKEFERGKDVDSEARLKFLWQNLLVDKFEKATEASKELFILLDGVEVMSEPDRKMMLDLFQDLSTEKCVVRVLMTATENALIFKKGFGLPGCPKIALDEKIRNEKDIQKIMGFRINKSERLKSFKPKVWEKVEDKLLESPNPISTVDITMTVMEQAEDEKHGLEMIKQLTKQNGLHQAMIQTVFKEKSAKEREFFRLIFALCTFTQRPLSIYVLREFAKQESMFRSSGLDVAHQIETSLSNFLYVTNISDEKLAPEAEVVQGSDKEGAKVALSKKQIVTFRQAAFREYLEKDKNELIPEPLKAKVSFFVKLTNLLCGKDTESAGLRDNFQDYAARWFMKHLKAIDVKKTDPPEGRQIVEALARVFRNEGNVSRIFEDLSSQGDDEHAYVADVYDISVEQGETGFEKLTVLQEWAKKMDYHNEEDLTSQAKEWVNNTILYPRKMLDNLAQGHFQRWTETKTYEEAKVPYNFLCRVLQLRQKGSSDSEEVSAAQIVALLEYAIKGKFIQTPTQIARCRISAALVLHDGGSSDEADRTSVRELYETNLEIKTTPGPENFYSHLGLAELFCRGGAEDPEDTMDDQRDQRWKSVSDHVDKALRAWWKEKDALGSDLNEERCIKAFLLKATALEQLGDDEEAIKTCHRCIEEDFQYNPLLSDFLSFLVDVHVKREEWAKIIGLIWRQKPNVRAEFLYRNLFELPSKERATLLLKASVKSNRIDYIIRIFERAREYGEGRDDPYVCLMTWMLVIIYNTVARVPKMAEHLMMEGLPDSDPYSDLYHYFVFPELVDVYHEYFMNACSEKAELGSLEKLKTAMKSYEKNIFQESSVLSMAELTLAKMYFKLGDLQQVQAHINRAFDICIIDLKDSISSNDQGALRALAKALAFVGLESEAQLAFSLQFSQFEESEDGGPLPEALDLPLPDPETSSGHDSVDEPEPNGKIIDKIVIHQTSTEDATHLPKTGDLNQQNNKEPEQLSKGEPDEPSRDPEEPSKDKGKQPIKPFFSFSQDLNFMRRQISCDGDCDPSVEMLSFEPQGPKLMYCLDCMDTEFCVPCYKQQINFFDKGENGFWFKGCWARHEYLQAPIDGWLGVKDGFIYVEKRDEDPVEIRKVQWEDWLISVQCRWKKRLQNPGLWEEIRARQRPRALF